MQTSALVASEWYMRNGFFPGWGRPYEFASELLGRLGGRDDEARDMARWVGRVAAAGGGVSLFWGWLQPLASEQWLAADCGG